MYTNAMQPDEDCCGVWPLIASSFEWTTPRLYPHLLTTPHIVGDDDIKYFVNFCPACGKPARNRIMRSAVW